MGIEFPASYIKLVQFTNLDNRVSNHMSIFIWVYASFHEVDSKFSIYLYRQEEDTLA